MESATVSNPYTFSWARLVSDVLSPPIVWSILAFPIAFYAANSRGHAVRWASFYAVIVCLLPLLYIALMVKLGYITDIHMKVRQQRILPFVVAIVCTVLAWYVTERWDAPPVLSLFALFILVQLIVMALITLVWQISMHAMSISGAAVTTGVLYGFVPGLVLVPLVMLVAAARLKLRRHTPAQVIAGTIVGAVVPFLVFVLIN